MRKIQINERAQLFNIKIEQVRHQQEEISSAIYNFIIINLVFNHIHMSQMKKEDSFNSNLAQFEVAQKEAQKQSNRFYKGEEVSWFPPLAYFKMYGVGIHLFFSFLKHASIAFLILTILSIVPIVFNWVKGNMFRKSKNDLGVLLTKFSLGSYKYSQMTVSTTSYSTSIQYKALNVSFDLIACVVFLAFCLYWERKSRNIAKHISNQIKLQSNQTIEVINFPQNTTEKLLEEFLGRFGKITEIVAAKDYADYLNSSREIYLIQAQINELQLQDSQKNKSKIAQLNQDIKLKYEEYDRIQIKKIQIIKYFVQFETPEDCQQVLRKFEPYQGGCGFCKTVPESLLLLGQRISIQKTNTEPSGVIWENIPYTWKRRAPRYILQIIIILGIIVGGFILISFLNILIPPIDSDIDTTSIDYKTVQSSTNIGLVKAWCIQNFQLPGTITQYSSTCNSYWQLYVQGTAISLTISIIVMIICDIVKKIVYALSQFQKFPTKSERSVSIMTNIFIMDFFTTTIITFLMQANVFGLSVMDFLDKLVTSNNLKNNIKSINQYSDLTSNWYKDIGYQIWLNIFLMVFLPQIFQPFTLRFSEFIQHFFAKRQKVHRKMVERLTPSQFQIEDQYANILVIISTGVIFGGGIQFMMVAVFLCLLVKYFYMKFFFIRYCRVPPQYNEQLNERLITIMKIILIIRMFISLYMYGANDIFAMEQSQFMKWANSVGVAVVQSVFIILSRAALTWYYTIVAIILILALIFKELIFKITKKIKNCRKVDRLETSENVTMENIEQKNTKNSRINSSADVETENSIQSWASNQNETVRSQRTTLKSYRLQHNPEYHEMLAIMRMRRTKSLFNQVSNETESVQQVYAKPLQNNKSFN